jgi:hypothetical protein
MKLSKITIIIGRKVVFGHVQKTTKMEDEAGNC